MMKIYNNWPIGWLVVSLPFTVTCTLAPRNNNSLAVSTFPPRNAMCNGVAPFKSAQLTFAFPSSINVLQVPVIFFLKKKKKHTNIYAYGEEDHKYEHLMYP